MSLLRKYGIGPLILLTFLAFVTLCCAPKPIKVRPVNLTDNLLKAIRMAESGDNVNIEDGDNGKAIGVYQIHLSYFTDSAEFDTTLGDDYQKCRDPKFAERVVIAYMTRYAAENATAQDLAMLHNGGCNILKKKNTKAWRNAFKYWKKVQKELAKL